MAAVGDKIDGTVETVTDFGLFVKDADENTYLLGLHELWWDRRGLPSEFAAVGDTVAFVVTKVDPDRVVNLGSPKMAFPELDAWRDPTQFTVGNQFSGTVTHRASYGVFVEHPLGIEALLHVSQIPSTRCIEVGDTLHVEILSSDQDSRQIAIRLVDSETEEPSDELTPA